MDDEISRMDITAFVAPASIPGWPREGRGFYVVTLKLKKPELSAATLSLIASKINQRIVFALLYGEKIQLVIAWNRQIRSDWKKPEDIKITLRINAEETWLGVIADIAGLKPGNEAELEAQIALRDMRNALHLKIEKLDKAMRREAQNRRRRELYEQIKNLKKELEELGETI